MVNFFYFKKLSPSYIRLFFVIHRFFMIHQFLFDFMMFNFIKTLPFFSGTLLIHSHLRVTQVPTQIDVNNCNVKNFSVPTHSYTGTSVTDSPFLRSSGLKNYPEWFSFLFGGSIINKIHILIFPIMSLFVVFRIWCLFKV